MPNKKARSKKAVKRRKIIKKPLEKLSSKRELRGDTIDTLDLNKNSDIFKLIRGFKDEEIKQRLRKHLHYMISASKLSEKYKIIFLYDSYGSIMDYDLNKIHGTLLKEKGKKDILLIIHSKGGSIEPAYLISKSCKEFSDKFVVVIPRKAKSAATLLALGADEIHMGTISQLGPIDPQMRGKSVLALGNAVEYLAEITEKYPGSGNMFARYLRYELDLKELGYFKRISESAVQYAERLLEGKNLPNKQTAKDIAEKFTYFFKDHSFVIDKGESKKYLGEHIKSNTLELELGEELFSWMNNIDVYLGLIKKRYLVVSGDCMHGGMLFLKKPKE